MPIGSSCRQLSCLLVRVPKVLLGSPAVAALSLMACSPAAVRPDACRGSELVFELLRERCRVAGRAPEAGLPAGIEVSVDPAELELRSGERANAFVVLTNATDSPATIELPLHLGLRAEIYAGETRLRAKPPPGTFKVAGVIARLPAGRIELGPGVRVVLEARGTLRLPLRVEAALRPSVIRVVSDRASRRPEPVPEPVPPGQYRLVVSLPWASMVGASLTVTPAEAQPGP
ncbi:MAG: hypothetical protein JXR96_01140 [Deltaproteobacteria bacterium]|nr:hypothetical protein [Deltaproteobacteria bacterium]